MPEISLQISKGNKNNLFIVIPYKAVINKFSRMAPRSPHFCK
jgi:hypothetical protein